MVLRNPLKTWKPLLTLFNLPYRIKKTPKKQLTNLSLNTITQSFPMKLGWKMNRCKIGFEILMNPCMTWKSCCNFKILVELGNFQNKCSHLCRKKSLPNKKFTSWKKVNNKTHTTCYDLYRKIFLNSDSSRILPYIKQYFNKLWVNV